MVGVLAAIGLLKHRLVMVALTVGLWICAAWVTFTKYHGLNPDVSKMLAFLPLFLTGSLLYLYWDKIPDSGHVALGCTGLFVASLWLPFGNAESFDFYTRINAPTLFAFALVYPLIWLGIHLPFHMIGAQNDYSYGTYVYASPVQQLLAISGVQRWGVAIYMVVGVAGTLPFAVASWWIIEKHALKLKKVKLHIHDEESPLPVGSSSQ